MIKRLNTQKGQSLLEYATLVVFIIGAFLLFQQYIARGISGRWKQAGDSMGLEKTFQRGRDDCANDVFTDRPNIWYQENCFRQNCFDACMKYRETAYWRPNDCQNCIANCPCPF